MSSSPSKKDRGLPAQSRAKRLPNRTAQALPEPQTVYEDHQAARWRRRLLVTANVALLSGMVGILGTLLDATAVMIIASTVAVAGWLVGRLGVRHVQRLPIPSSSAVSTPNTVVAGKHDRRLLAEMTAHTDQLRQLTATFPPGPVCQEIADLNDQLHRWLEHPPSESFIPDLRPYAIWCAQLDKRLRRARWALWLGLPLTKDVADMLTLRRFEDRLDARLHTITAEVIKKAVPPPAKSYAPSDREGFSARVPAARRSL